jgi:hypothetical protein
MKDAADSLLGGFLLILNKIFSLSAAERANNARTTLPTVSREAKSNQSDYLVAN